MFAFLSLILIIIDLLSLYLHTFFISSIYVIIVLFIMLIYSYSIYKEFNIEDLDRIIFKFFIFLTLGLWIFILFIVTHMAIVLSFESIFLNIMYSTIKDLIFYYFFITYFSC
jgi:signal transduction histidine kinase